MMERLHYPHVGKRKPCKREKQETATAIRRRNHDRRRGVTVAKPLMSDRITLSFIAVKCAECQRCPNHARRMKAQWEWFAEQWGAA